MTVTVTAPGVYALNDADYHGDPVPDRSVSCSGAKLLLPPNTPAHYDWARRNAQPPKRIFDFGHAAHAKVLGTGMDIVVVRRTAKDGTVSDADDYRTKSAQEHRDAIYAEGKTPLLAHEAQQVDDMAAAILAHPNARALFDPDHGEPEQSLFWRDPQHVDVPVWIRARLDWLPHTRPGRRLVIPDYKTALSADTDTAARAIANLGYHRQDDWYRGIVQALDIADDPDFVFVLQEKTPPYLVNVVRLDAEARMSAARLNERAVATYARCTASGEWPGFPHDSIPTVSLPVWATRELEYA